jgi:hypothetical protein
MFERHIETNEFLRVPMAGNRYAINIRGQIKDSEEITIETTSDTEGHLVAWLYLWEGWKHYRVAMLIAHTFKPTHVPFSYWSRLNVLYLDGHLNNIHPANLVWKFPIGLQCNRYPGYAFIPGFSKYVINRAGEVIQFLTDRVISTRISEKGYRKIQLKPDIGQQTNVGRHRLLGLAWLDYPVNVDKMHINHLNGIPGSDALTNLEWTTPKGNIYHALRTGLKPDGKEIIVRHIETGVVSSFYTEAQACEALGFYRGAIRNVTNFALAERQPFEGYDIRLVREGVFWPDVSLHEHFDVLDSGKDKVGEEDPYATGAREDARAVSCLHVRTGKVTEFRSLALCAKALGVCIPTIHHRANHADQRLYDGGYLVKDADPSVPWREVSEQELKSTELPGVLVRQANTGEVTEYANIGACAEALGLKYDKLYHMLTIEDQPVFKGYWQLQYKCALQPWRLPQDVEQEHERALHGLAVLARNIVTQEVTEYASACECALVLGLSEMTVAARLRMPSQKVFPGHLQFKRKHDPTPWREVVSAEKELENRHYPTCVRVRDIFTHQEWTFPSLAVAANELNLPMHVLITRKNSKEDWPYFNYAFRFDEKDWRHYSKEDLLMLQQAIVEGVPFRGRGYKLTNVATSEVTLYSLASAVAQRLAVTKGHVRDLARTEEVFRQTWRLQYYFKIKD